MTTGDTIRTSREQWLEPKNEETAVTLASNNTDLIWKLFSTRPATYTLTASGLMIASPERMIAGMEYMLALKQDATGNRNVNWGVVFQWADPLFPDGAEPIPNTSANALNVYKFYCDGVSMFGKLVYRTQE